MNKLIGLLGLFFCVVAGAQDNTFYRKYNLGGMQGGLTLRPTADGGFVASGQHEGNGSAGGCDVYVYRVDECGNRLWMKLIGEGASEGAKSIEELPNGDFLFTGHSSSGLVGRMDADGQLMWMKNYPGTDWIMQGIGAANGDLICIARQPSGLPILMRLDAGGTVLWSKGYPGFGQMPLYVDELENGDIIFVSTYNSPGKDMALARTDPNGNLVWGVGYGAGYGDADFASWSCAAAVNEDDGSIAMTSVSQGQGGLPGDNILVIKADLADGAVQWSRAYGGPGSDQSRAIIPTPQGYAICGNSNSYPVAPGGAAGVVDGMGERNVLLLHIDAMGDIIWSRQYGASARDKGIGVGYGADGSFTMSAYTASGYFGSNDGSMDPLFIKTDSLGRVICQSADCPVTGVAVDANTSTLGTSTPVSITAEVRSPVVSDLTVNDIYVCQDCYTVPVFALSDSLVCVNEPVYFYNQTSVGLTCFQEWNVNGETFSGGIDTITYVFSESGYYPILLYSTCGNDTMVYDLSVRVSEVFAEGSVTSDYNGYGVSCHGASDGMVSANGSGGYFPPGTQWDFSWVQGSTGPDLAVLPAGNYQCSVQDGVGCTDSVTIVITEPEPLLPLPQIVDATCHGACNATATVDVQGGTPSYSFFWSPAPGSGQGTSAASAFCSGNASVLVSDINGCDTLLSFTLAEPPPLVNQPAATVVSCPDMCDATATADVSGGTPPYGFLWSPLPGLGQGTPQVEALCSDMYTLLVTDANGCELSDEYDIADPVPLAMEFLFTQATCPGGCDGGASVVTSGGTGPYGHFWSQETAAPPGSTSAAGLCSGIYGLTVMDALGCDTSVSFTINEPAPFVVQAEVVNVNCFSACDGSIQLFVGGATPGYQYTWVTEVGSGEGTALVNGLCAVVHEVLVTDAAGCDTTVQVEVIEPDPLNDSLSIASNYSGFAVSCFGSADAVIAHVSGHPYGGTAPYACAMLPPNNLATIVAPGSFSSLAAGVYDIVTTDANGCFVEQRLVLNEPPPLEPLFTVAEDTCGTGRGAIYPILSGGVQPYLVLLDDEVMPADQGITGQVNGLHELTVEDANGCAATVPVLIPMLPGSRASFAPDSTTSCFPGEVLLEDDSGPVRIVSGEWDFGDGERQPYRWSDVMHRYPEAGTYTARLTIEDSYGCVHDTSMVVVVMPDLRVFIPNAFSPNGDVLNDTFMPVVSGVDTYRLLIFDRWGRTVFESSDPAQPWDGTVDGIDARPEVFAYRLEVSGSCGKLRTITGHVLLIR
jgi:gliding motility-associated-like protein